jgi:dUTP pyrophosphatase
MNKLKVKLLSEDGRMPTKAYPSDSGFDLYTSEAVEIYPFETKVIKTGISFGIPSGFEVQIRPRSGVSSKTPLKVILGTVDNQYSGELGIMCQNISNKPQTIPKGFKLAQAVPMELPSFTIELDTDLDESELDSRGDNGFGSSGAW